MGKILTFVSGKGGTGKTSLCAAVAGCLSAMGDRVVCIDADVGLRDLDLALGMTREDCVPFSDVQNGLCALSDVPGFLPLRGLKLLTAPEDASAETLDTAAFSALAEACREEFDFCLIDAPAGIGPLVRFLARTADENVLVTLADSAAMRDGAAAARLLPEGKPARLIVNRVSRSAYAKIGRTVDDIMDTVGLPLLGIVPEDPAVPLSAEKGAPLITQTQKGAAAAALRIARRLKGIRTPLAAR